MPLKKRYEVWQFL